MASPRTVYVAGGSYPVSGVSQHVITTVANQVPRLSHPDKGPPPEVTVFDVQIAPLKTMGYCSDSCFHRSALHPARPSPLLRPFQPVKTGPFKVQRTKEGGKSLLRAMGSSSQGTIDITKAGNAMSHYIIVRRLPPYPLVFRRIRRTNIRNLEDTTGTVGFAPLKRQWAL
jgi:hypothetical protein